MANITMRKENNIDKFQPKKKKQKKKEREKERQNTTQKTTKKKKNPTQCSFQKLLESEKKKMLKHQLSDGSILNMSNSSHASVYF